MKNVLGGKKSEHFMYVVNDLHQDLQILNCCTGVKVHFVFSHLVDLQINLNLVSDEWSFSKILKLWN